MQKPDEVTRFDGIVRVQRESTFEIETVGKKGIVEHFAHRGGFYMGSEVLNH
jgi:hypothetical protein